MAKNNKAIGVSVIICTHNGNYRLLQVLDALAAQDSDLFEVIVVDNNSTDETAAIASSKLSSMRVKTTFLTEKSQGKRFALVSGVKRASYGLIAIVDDDNIVGPDYIKKSLEFFEKNPETGYLGVSTYLITEDGKSPPSWWEKFKHLYAVGDQYARSGELASFGGCSVWGAGMVFRSFLWREVYERYESPLAGRNNINLVAGEDSEFCYLCSLIGWKGYYIKDMKVGHIMTPQRLTKEYLLRLSWSFGAGAVANRFLIEQVDLRKSKCSWTKLSLKRSRRFLILFYSTMALFCSARELCSSTSTSRLAWRVKKAAYVGSLSATKSLSAEAMWRFPIGMSRLRPNF